MSRHGLTSLLACCLSLAAATPALADGHTLQNSRLTIVFGSSRTGFTTNDADRVDAIAWIDSSGTATTNWVANAPGPLHCGDPQEYFGEAYGDTSDSGVPRPNAVIGGVTSVWSGTNSKKGSTIIRSLATCDETLDARTTTHYALYGVPTLLSSMSVVRTFVFAKNAAHGNMRVYVARLPLATYPYTLYPNAAGVVQTVNVNGCPENCTVTDWNGKWMADDDGHGNGMAIFRDPTANPAAQLTIDWDGYSSSNNSAITIVMPTAGWKGTVAETEYLCFYDSGTWNAARQKAGKPPLGCTGVPH